MKLNLDDMRTQVKRALCKHDYNTIAMHKCARANLWKCEKCGDIGMRNYIHGHWIPHWNDKVVMDDWCPFPSSRDLKGELDE